MPPQPPLELMEELVEEVLLRFPPDDPASLVRAALVCKLWCRLVCGTAFRCRFGEFHRSRAPLLGVVYTGDCKLRHDVTPGDTDDPSVKPASTAYFVPTTSFHPAKAADGWRAIDARHGRVLLYQSYCWPWPQRHVFSVWDPVMDEQRDLPDLSLNTRHRYFKPVVCAAVACAATAGGNCNHLDCHRGPFVVVAISIQACLMHLSVYSSEAGAWSQQADFELPTPSLFSARAPSVLVGSTVHFLVHYDDGIVKYDLATREVSKILLPSKFHHLLASIVLMTDDDGGLGFVANMEMEYKLELCTMSEKVFTDACLLNHRRATAGGDADFVLRRVIDLARLLPCRALINKSPQVSGFADVGASRFLLMRTSDGLYSIEINCSHVKKVAHCCDNDKVVLPYVSFCTPTSRVQVQEYTTERMWHLEGSES